MSFATRLEIPPELLERIHRHGESAYPEEGAGFLLGHGDGDRRVVTDLLTIRNAREDSARHNRYLMTPKDVLDGEIEAERRGLDIVGVFHSHPDHPNRPSEFDREWALPWYSYIITSVNAGTAVESRSWRLSDNRLVFNEEEIFIVAEQEKS
ncbi:MAG: M67 family metallopeptidase [Anaerolineales bacterium]|jgi:proteasome lid subunit RPN8/RPN11